MIPGKKPVPWKKIKVAINCLLDNIPEITKQVANPAKEIYY